MSEPTKLTLFDINKLAIDAYNEGDTEKLANIVEIKKGFDRDQLERGISSEDIPDLREIKFGFDSGRGFTELSFSALDSFYNMGNVFGHHDKYIERFGDDWLNANTGEKRAKLKEKYRNEQLETNFPLITALQQKGGTSATLVTSEVVKSLLDPTTVLFRKVPLSNVTKTTGISGGFGASYSIAEQLATKGTIDPAELATTTAVSAGFGTLLGVAAKGVNKLRGKDPLDAQKQADKLANKINDTYVQGAAAGLKEQELDSYVKQTLDLDDVDIITAFRNSTEKMAIPASQEAAQEVLKLGAAVNNRFKFVDKVLDPTRDVFEVLSSRLEAINPKLKRKIRDLEKNEFIMKGRFMRQAQPFFKFYSSLDNETKEIVDDLANNGRYEDIARIFDKQVGTVKVKQQDDAIFSRTEFTPSQAIDNLKQMYRDMADYQEKVGGFLVNRQPSETYFSRNVRDLDGLRNYLDKTENVQIKNELSALLKGKSKSEQDQIIIDYLRGDFHARGGGSPRVPKSLKQRALPNGTITKDMSKQFYDSADKSIESYIIRGVDKTEEALFFGENAVRRTATGNDIDYESLSDIVIKMTKDSDVTPTQMAELQKLLEARFVNGKQTMSSGIARNVRGLGHAGAVANPITALANIEDIFLTALKYGIRDSLTGLAKTGVAFGKRDIAGKKLSKEFTIDDFELSNYIAAELATANDVSRLLNESFRASGFKAIDRVGKDIAINTAFANGVRLAKNIKAGGKKGKAAERRLRQFVGKGYDDFDKLVDDLAGERTSDLTMSYVFGALSDVQPLSLSEVPYGYSKSNNARLLYMLKTFGIRRLNTMRDMVVKEMQAGNKLEAMKNAAGFLTILPLAGATIDEAQDYLLGRGANLQDIPDNYINKLFQAALVSKYAAENQLFSGDVVDKIELVLPPFNLIEGMMGSVANAIDGQPAQEVLEPTLSEAPVFGNLFKAHVFGDKYNKRDKREGDYDKIEPPARDIAPY